MAAFAVCQLPLEEVSMIGKGLSDHIVIETLSPLEFDGGLASICGLWKPRINAFPELLCAP